MPTRSRSRRLLRSVEAVCPYCGGTHTLTTYVSWTPSRLGRGRRDERTRTECSGCHMRWDAR